MKKTIYLLAIMAGITACDKPDTTQDVKALHQLRQLLLPHR